MDLSVIVVASSRASSLRKCLRALHDATSVSFEVVVIWVGTPRAGEEATRKLSKEFPGCRILLCERAPQDDTLRQAVSSAKGSFLCLLTEEIRLLGSWFEGLREHVDAVEDGGVFAPMILNGQGRQGLKLDSHRAVDVAELARHLRQRYRHRRAFVDLPQEACLFFGRPLLERVPLPELHAPGRKSFLRRWCETVSAAGLQNVIAGDVFVFADTPPQRREASPSSGAFRSRAMAEARNGNLREAVSRIVQRIREDPGNVRHPLFLAELFLESDRPREALEILESLPAETGEPHRTTLCGLAHRHLGRGDLARQMAEAVLRNYPRHAPAWRLAGLSAVDAGRGDEAKECFARAIRSDPSWGIPRADLGRLLLSEGKREEARGELEKAFLLSPAEPAVATAYFDILSMFEFPLEAGELFQAALSLYPEDRRLRFLYIALLLRQNHYADAMREIERAMEIFPLDEGMLRSALAVRKHVGPLRVDEHKTSIPSLSACLIVKNEENRICGCIGSLRGLVDEIVLVDTGSTDRTARIAEALGARVVETAWRDDFAAARNVSLSEARGDWVLILDADERISAEDHERIRRLITRHRKKKAAFRLVTRNYTDECGARGWAANDGSYPELEKASGWFPSVKVRLFPRDPRIRFVHPVHEVVEPTIRKLGLPILDGDVPVHHYGRLDQAKLREKGKHYLFLGMKKLDRLGDDETALRELASQAAGIGEYAQALQLWERLLRIRPDDAAAWMNAGFAALRCARFEQAVAHSKRALELDPGMREAALNLAAGHWARGALAGTEEVLERLLAKEKDYPPALCRMAALRFVQGENEAALFLARRLRSLGFDPEGAFRDLAAELRQGGREDLARLLAEHAAGAGEGAAGSGPPALPDKDSSPARRSPGEACRKPEASMPTVPAALP
ncbi:MAG: tetratricopeptide repeat protein [Desulfobacterales bacterium]